MKLIAKVKLVTNREQKSALLTTMTTANSACNWISERAFAAKKFGQFALHTLCYHPARQTYPTLNSETIVRAIGKVSDAYALNKAVLHRFKPKAAIVYDRHILSWKLGTQMVSIWAIGGRLKLPFVAGPHQLEYLAHQQGQSDLIYHKGEFYLAATCNFEEPMPEDVAEFLGVDLGVANVAADSDGKLYSGSGVKSIRHRNRRLRTKLQKKQTRSAKRKLKSLSGHERRFATDVNHVISKQIVAIAQRTKRGIALEQLKGIRQRIRARRDQRAVLHSWAFYQLGEFLKYKAKKAGVVVKLIDPRNTSRTCPECGNVDKNNRTTQSKFKCTACGHSGIADLIAAKNIGRAATVRPIVASCA